MWTYRQAQHGTKPQDWRIWTVVVPETDGRRWMDFEIGDRSEASLQRRYARLPESELYRSDAYAVYGRLPLGQQVKGKGGAVNRTRILHS